MGKFLVLSISIFIIFSCTTEGVNLSPLENVLSDADFDHQTSISERIEKINNASEITNIISRFPKFSSDDVNKETEKLKNYLENYIENYEKGNSKELKNKYLDYEKSYKKLQKLKHQLNSDEINILDRYLAQIKTNMNLLDSEKTKDNNFR
ncbi:MAG: hypothetical protein LBE36_05455 [Flavobacteriaceae bacterium]|jgi:hypothetical protein|nr:hypothetical protein [Flavobacteriaceae bacterium]